MLEAAEAFPINLGFLGKENSFQVYLTLEEQIFAGAIGIENPWRLWSNFVSN